MTATDELRDGLTKRGIKWRWEDERTTYWYVTVDGEEWGEWTAIEMGGYLHLSFSSGDVLTPAQAIAATLGPTDPRERGLIPHFWTSDWTLHIEAARLPERIDVTLPDQRAREVYSARVHRFVPERTCRKVYLVETSDDLIESWYPIGIYLRKETAEDCAESLRGKHVGIKHFARVVELEVMDE